MLSHERGHIMAMFGRATSNDQLRSYTPTMAERIPIALQGMFGKLGLDKYKARSFAKPIADALEWSPLGAAAAAIDAGVAARKSPTTTGMFGNLAGGAALAALGAVPGGKALRGVARDAERGIVAYHGSPHTFDKFSLDKIGTGEGAQAYGHGLYFAENEATAKAYRDKVKDMGTIGGINARMSELADIMGKSEIPGKYRQYRTPEGFAAAKEYDDLMAARHNVSTAPGSMYQVRINADPADFLDWDKPLAEQSGDTINALREGYKKSFGVSDRYLDETLHPGATLNSAIGGGRMSPIMTENLKNLGIPGIKYLDAGSRGAGDGSRNFVVFNDKLIDILKRYGWVPGTAVPTALMARAQSEAMGTPEAGGI